MAFGKLRKIWEKIKGVGRKVWGGIKKALPFIKPIAGFVSNIVAPGSGAAVTTAINTAEGIGDKFLGSKSKTIVSGFRPLGERLKLS
jgi:hypothetical protein